MKYYYTHTPLFFRHFSKLGRSFPTELPFSPPSSIHPCPLPFARDRFYSYPPKMAKGWVEHRIFRFSAERNAFIGTSTGYKVYFRRPSRNSRLKADFLTPNIRTTRETNFPYRGWGNSVEDRSERSSTFSLFPPFMTRLIDRFYTDIKETRFDRSRSGSLILFSTIESKSVGRLFQAGVKI